VPRRLVQGAAALQGEADCPVSARPPTGS